MSDYGILDIVKDALTLNLEFASAEVQAKRLELCNACPHLGKLIRDCKVCGCLVDAKVQFTKADCPINKW